MRTISVPFSPSSLRDWMLAVIWPLEASGIVLAQNGCSFCCQLVRLDHVPTTLKDCLGRSCASALPADTTAHAVAIDATSRLTIFEPPIASNDVSCPTRLNR